MAAQTFALGTVVPVAWLNDVNSLTWTVFGGATTPALARTALGLGTVALENTVPVAKGGTGDTSLTAYAILAGGTTSTGTVQSIASVGTTGQMLVSAGAAALPAFATMGLLRIDTYTSGTATLTAAPTNSTKGLVLIWGAGGGSGGTDGSHNGAGGGSGGFGMELFTVAQLAGQTYIVGVGGVAGTAVPGAGGNGGDSSIGAVISAIGGNGSAIANGGISGGVGGTSSAAFNINGGAGGQNNYQDAGVGSLSGQGGIAAFSAQHGAGANAAGVSPGGGGFGAVNYNSAGLAGGSGRITILWF